MDESSKRANFVIYALSPSPLQHAPTPPLLRLSNDLTPNHAGGGLNLDDMLSDLTSNPIANLASGNGFDSKSTASKRKKGLTTPQSSRFRRSPISGSASLANAVPRGGARRSSVPSSWTVRDYEDTEAGGIEEDDFRASMDDGGIDIPGGSAEEEEDVPMHDEDKPLEGKMSGPAKQAAAGDAVSGGAEKVPVVSQETEEDKTLVAPEPVEDSAAAAKPRSRFARMKETNDIAVTAAAEAVLRPKPEVTDVLQPMGQGTDVGKRGVVGNNYKPSLDFQGPQYELSEAPVTPAGSIPNTSSWLHKVQKRSNPLSVDDRYGCNDRGCAALAIPWRVNTYAAIAVFGGR